MRATSILTRRGWQFFALLIAVSAGCGDATVDFSDSDETTSPSDLPDCSGPYVSSKSDPRVESHIYFIDAAQSAATAIADEGNARNPQLSPDGTHLAFEEVMGKPIHPLAAPAAVKVSDTTGNQRRTLLAAPARLFGWSPDGSTLLAETQSESGQRSMVTVTLDGVVQELDKVPTGSMGSGRWSPRGDKIALAFEPPPEGTSTLRLVDVATGSTSTLSDLDGVFGAPTWSPNGATIGFAGYVEPPSHKSAILLIDISSRELTEVKGTESSGGLGILGWPSEDRIVTLIDPADGPPEIRSFNRAGASDVLVADYSRDSEDRLEVLRRLSCSNGRFVPEMAQRVQEGQPIGD